MSYSIPRERVPKDAACRICGKRIGKLDNIGEYRNRYPGPTMDFMCMSCHMTPGLRRESGTPKR